MNFTVPLGDNQFETFQMAPKDAAGNESTQFASGPEITSDNEAVATGELNADKLGGTIRAKGLGSCTLRLVAVNTNGLQLEDTFAITVAVEAPNSLNTTLGTPTENPEAPLTGRTGRSGRGEGSDRG